MRRNIRSANVYNRYFDGYSEVRVTDKSGTERIKRIYTGKYYRSCQSKVQYYRAKVLYIGLYILAVASYFLAGTARLAANETRCSMVASCSIFISILLTGASLITKLLSKQKMILREYNTGVVNFEKRTLAGVICALAALIVLLVDTVLYGTLNASGTVCCAAEYLVTAACFFTMLVISKKTPYTEEQNSVTVPNADVEISY